MVEINPLITTPDDQVQALDAKISFDDNALFRHPEIVALRDLNEQVVAAFKIILTDPKVKGIFVNIFGGIMDCNVIAAGIVEAVKEVGLQLPLVVRLEGNNVVAGKQTLAASGLQLVSGDSMADAAQKIVRLVA